MSRISVAVTAILLCIASDAFAAGFYLPGRGVRPLGRAGANIASSKDDLNAIWYNPANLGGDELQLVVDLALINLSFDFQRAPRVDDNGDVVTTYDSVSNEAPAKPIPQVLVGGPLPIEGFSWAFGIFAPYLSGHTFPENGAQRYTLVDNDASLLLFMQFAVSWQINDVFSIGAGFQNVPARFKLVSVSSAFSGLFGDPEDEDLDILSEVTMTDLFAPSGNIGMSIKFSDIVTAGISFQAPVIFHTSDAKLRVRLPSHPQFQPTEFQGDSLTGGMKFPAVLRAGIAISQENFDVEIAGTFEGWSISDEIEAVPKGLQVTDLPGIGTLPVGPLTIPLNWQDTFSIRIGGEYRFSEQLAIRGGYAYETSAIPDEYYSVFLADGDKHLFALGGTWQVSKTFGLDAGFGYYLIPSREITNSQWRQINPTDNSGKVTLTVGNGTYSQSYFAGGIGTYFRF